MFQIKIQTSRQFHGKCYKFTNFTLPSRLDDNVNYGKKKKCRSNILPIYRLINFVPYLRTIFEIRITRLSDIHDNKISDKYCKVIVFSYTFIVYAHIFWF